MLAILSLAVVTIAVVAEVWLAVRVGRFLTYSTAPVVREDKG